MWVKTQALYMAPELCYAHKQFEYGRHAFVGNCDRLRDFRRAFSGKSKLFRLFNRSIRCYENRFFGLRWNHFGGIRTRVKYRSECLNNHLNSLKVSLTVSGWVHWTSGAKNVLWAWSTLDEDNRLEQEEPLRGRSSPPLARTCSDVWITNMTNERLSIR